jgi:hypothetical protein
MNNEYWLYIDIDLKRMRKLELTRKREGEHNSLLECIFWESTESRKYQSEALKFITWCEFYVSVGLGHGLLRCLFKHYSGCFNAKYFRLKLTFTLIDWLTSCHGWASFNHYEARVEQKGWLGLVIPCNNGRQKLRELWFKDSLEKKLMRPHPA